MSAASRWRTLWIAFAASSLLSRAGAASEGSCTPAFERAQELRAQAKRMEAREQLAACAKACTEDLRRYCVTWLAEVEAELASVVVVARRAGADVPLSEVRIQVDGVDREHERGRLVLEPGTHRIVFSQGGQTVAHTVRLEAGAPPTSVVATFDTPPSAPPSTPPPPVQRDEGPPAATWVLVGLGGVALTVAAALAINGHRQRAELMDSCSPECDPSLADPIRAQWLAAGLLAGGGAAALIGAGITAFVGGDKASNVALHLRGRF